LSLDKQNLQVMFLVDEGIEREETQSINIRQNLLSQ